MSPSEPAVEEPIQPPGPASTWREMRTTEDWWSIWCAGLLLVVCFAAVWFSRPADLAQRAETAEAVKVTSPLKGWLAKPASWQDNPLEAFYVPAEDDEAAEGDEAAENDEAAEGDEAAEADEAAEGDVAAGGDEAAEDSQGAAAVHTWRGVLGVFVVIGVLFTVAMALRGQSAIGFLKGFPIVFLLATLAYVMAAHVQVKAYNLEYALWALLIGLIISNTVGTPEFIKKAALTEFFIKTGLVLLGAEVLMSRLLALGLPGIFVAWVVTPIVLVCTYIFGQKVLRIPSRSLNMVISADMSVCGVSAAIATAAACKAKKEELSLAIGMSLSFTVVMMVVMPAIIKATGMSEILGGAWVGGTIDSTGAVAVAGAVLGDRALEVAATVKMIQNILIGVTAFFVAIYWVTYVERDASAKRPGAMEIWYRFPKFVLGFVLASVVFSVLFVTLQGGPEVIDAMIKGSTKTFRGWFFCLAFVSIGLETNFRALAPYFRGGRPLILYVCGQTLNLCLTLFMAWLMFRVIFADLIEQMIP